MKNIFKNKSQALIFIISVITFAQCKKSDSAKSCSATCQNGGSCEYNHCVCPAGYEGLHCDTLSRDKYIGTYVGYHINVDPIGKDSVPVTVGIAPVPSDPIKIYVACGKYIDSQICTMLSDGSFQAQLPGLTYGGGYNPATRLLYINIVSPYTAQTNFIVATKQ